MPSRSLRLAALVGTLAAVRLLKRRGRAPAEPDTSHGDAIASRRAPAFPWSIVVGLGAASVAITVASLGWHGWQKQAQAVAVAKALTRGDPARAPELITRYGCGGCHAIPGAPGADGKVAAPLGGMRERVFVGGVARNEADTLVRWIVAPQEISPHSAMPATGITEAEARDVAAFLYSH
jgi:cytochrome c2